MPVPSSSKSGTGAATMSSSPDVVHIAVINTVGIGGNQNHLLQISKKESLQSIVNQLCTQVWKLDNPADYALAFESKEYVTERSKEEKLQNGTILKLQPSPRKLVNDLVKTYAYFIPILCNELSIRCLDCQVERQQ